AGEALEIALAHQRLLDEDADRGVSALRKELRPEDGFVGQRAHWKREGPLAQPVLGTGHADRRNTKALLDRLTRRDGVVGDARTEDGKAAFVDELAVGVDHRLDRSLRKPFDLTERDLHGPVDDPVLHAFVEHELERPGQVGPHLLRVVLGQPRVEEVAELDRLCGALVGHNQLRVSSRYTLIISTRPLVTVASSVSGPATAARAASRGLSPSATSRPAAMSTRVEATSRSPVVSRRRMAWPSRTSFAPLSWSMPPPSPTLFSSPPPGSHPNSP